MSEKKVLHGGCCDCGSREQEILKSVMIPGESMGKALCDKCIEKRKLDV